MTLEEIMQSPPTRETQGAETVLRWGHDLGVVILKDGSVGQFYASERWPRRDVETAVSRYLESA